MFPFNYPPGGIATGPDGALWFTDWSTIGRVTLTGSITQFPLPTTSYIGSITAGPDGALWFTDPFYSKIGRITTAGLIDEFALPTSTGYGNAGITVGPDGELWLTNTNDNTIARIVLPLARPSVQPASGSGQNQTLTFQFHDATGAANLSVVNVLINDSLDGRNACYLAYSASSNTLFLVDDAGDGGGPFAGSMGLTGSSGSIENSQCRINNFGSSAVSSGTTLVLTLNMTFKAIFAGNGIVHVAQRDQAGFTIGWERLGVWQVPGAPAQQITVTGQNPARGMSTGGINQILNFTITDTAMFTNLGVIDVLMNDSLDGRNACYIAYDEGSNMLFLVDDAGDAGGPFAGSMVLDGSAVSVENNQCRIDGMGSSAVGNGTTLTLMLNVFFKSSFRGNHVEYVGARDFLDGHNTDWQALGTWSVQ